MGNTFTQIFPPSPKFTERDIPDQSGKVFLITGASSGLGLNLARLLHSKNGSIHLATRSESSAQKAIDSIKADNPSSTGTLHFLQLDLADLASVPVAARTFLGGTDASAPTRLDVLFLNAGVMVPTEKEGVTKQGWEAQLGVNCLGHFLFTKLLTPLLIQTAKLADGQDSKDQPLSSVGSPRVVWVSSSAAELSPKGGIDVAALRKGEAGRGWKKGWKPYTESKAGNVLYAMEMAKKLKGEGVIIVALNPGNLKTGLQRHLGGLQARIVNLSLYPAINGAYTELYAGLSPDITLEKSGAWIIPFGRLGSIRADLDKAAKTKEEGGTGIGRDFWEWSEEQAAQYL